MGRAAGDQAGWVTVCSSRCVGGDGSTSGAHSFVDPFHSIQSKSGAYYIEASAPQNKAGGGLLSAALPDDSRFAFTQAFSVLGAFTG